MWATARQYVDFITVEIEGFSINEFQKLVKTYSILFIDENPMPPTVFSLSRANTHEDASAFVL
ncbi:hypothetical protein AL705_01530 [Lawsonella clevelandensis]|uniref:Uncharacterized protein n=1 Tax=Lawsonella clevelandensis TaxID=1528099 RepID=A0A0M4MWY6_9ACTN|nr:hypothetical protein AL705_01530 [Lawsonella clevelandensis]